MEVRAAVMPKSRGRLDVAVARDRRAAESAGKLLMRATEIQHEELKLIQSSLERAAREFRGDHPALQHVLEAMKATVRLSDITGYLLKAKGASR